jgi:HSP20 family protein
MNYSDQDILRQMDAEMQRIAEETLRGFLREVPNPNKFWQPRVDLHETVNSIVVKVEVSGVKTEKLSVSISNDDRFLTISGERYEEDEERESRIRCYQLEIYFGPFERKIYLPNNVRINRDGIVANYRDGFLIITLPKREGVKSELRTIPVSE